MKLRELLNDPRIQDHIRAIIWAIIVAIAANYGVPLAAAIAAGA